MIPLNFGGDLQAIAMKGCCGANKHVDPANDLSLMRASNDSQRQ